MLALLFALIVVAVLISAVADIGMRIELSKQEVPGEKLSWWGLRGGDQVPETYQKLFPESKLPLLRNIPFYIVIFFATVVLILALRKSS